MKTLSPDHKISVKRMLLNQLFFLLGLILLILNNELKQEARYSTVGKDEEY